MPSILAPLMQAYRREFEEGAADTTDAQLLERYARGGDRVAFELLGWRHGPMVRGVCRRVLGNEVEAEDAYQTVFLTLSQKAPSLGTDAVLAGWLHRVAWRTAANAKRAIRRRRGREAKAARPEIEMRDPATAAIGRETLAIIDAAIARLPARSREPFVLCELEGRGREAAARELGIPLGTLDSRLARARVKLQSRLRLLVLPSLLVGPAAVVSVAPAAASSNVLPIAVGFGALAVKKTLIAATAAVALLAGAAWGPGMLGQEKAEKPPVKVLELKEAPAAPVMNFLDRGGAPLPAGAIARIGSQRLRHSAEVWSLAYSSDSKLLATASYSEFDCGVRIWNAESGREMLRIPLPFNSGPEGNKYIEDPTVGLRFSADGRKLHIVEPSAIRTWDIARKAEDFKFELPTDPHPDRYLIAASITPDCRSAFVGWWNGRLELRSLTDGKLIRDIAVPTSDDLGVCIDYLPDGKRFTIHGRSKNPDAIFRVDTLEQAAVLPAVDGWYWGPLRFMADGLSFAALVIPKERGPRHVRIVETATGKILRSVTVEARAKCLELTLDGNTLIVGNDDRNRIRILDAATLKETGQLPVGLGLTNLTLSPNGKRLAGKMYGSGAVLEWDLGTRQYSPASADQWRYSGARFSNDGRALILQSDDYRPRIDWSTGTTVPTSKETFSWGTSFYSGDGLIRVLRSVPDWERPHPVDLKVVDTTSGRVVREWKSHSDEVGTIHLSADGRRLLTAGGKAVVVWDSLTGRTIFRAASKDVGMTECTLLTGDGKKLITSTAGESGGNNKIGIWDVDSGRRLFNLEAESYFRNHLALSLDSRLIAGGGGQRKDVGVPENLQSEVTIWNAETGKVVHSLPFHTTGRLHPGAHCEFSPDSRLLVTGDAKGQLRLWEVATGQEVFAFVGHHSDVSAHFSPDGKLLVAASTEAPCYIWEVIPEKAAKPDPETAWKDLMDADAKKAFAAVRSLAANPAAALKLLGAKLQRINGDAWDGISPPIPERLRQIRAVEVLTYIGTPEALQIAERVK